MKAAKEKVTFRKLRLAVTLVGAFLCLGAGVTGASIPTSGEGVWKSGSFGTGTPAPLVSSPSFSAEVIAQIKQK